MKTQKYRISYAGGIVTHKAINTKKHSYRELSRRKFNGYVLEALKDEAQTIKSIAFWSKYKEKHYTNMVGAMQTALEVARTLKAEFKTLGKNMRLNNYAPYTNEIKQELFNTLQITLF